MYGLLGFLNYIKIRNSFTDSYRSIRVIEYFLMLVTHVNPCIVQTKRYNYIQHLIGQSDRFIGVQFTHSIIKAGASVSELSTETFYS
jgi:hypothetical protein